MEASHRKSLQLVKLRPLAVVPCSVDLAAPRVLDVAQALKARVVFAGETHAAGERRRLCAANVPTLRALRAGFLIITPAIRSDIMMAALSVQSGTPLAGLLLTGGHDPDPRVVRLCRKALDTGLPVLAVDESSYRAATHVASMNTEIPADDPDRIERTMNFVADRIDIEWVKGFGHSRGTAPSPPAPATASSSRPGRTCSASSCPGLSPAPRRGASSHAASPDACCWATRTRFAKWRPSRASPCPGRWRLSTPWRSPRATSSRWSSGGRPRA
jgi:hypothetical protein